MLIFFMRLILFALLFSTVLFAEFALRDVEVAISDIQKDGSAHVKETIRFQVIGDYEKSLYETGFDNNDILFWANATGINDIKLHINPNVVDLKPNEFALRPQPLRSCNSGLNLCQGELVLEYTTYPIYNESTDLPVPDTGVFTIEIPKPRNTRYSINPSAFAFTTTDKGDLRLEKNIYLIIYPPIGAIIKKEDDLNPKPENFERVRFPAEPAELRWQDMVLVKFTVIFDVEESLDKEVVEFFSSFFRALERKTRGEQGLAILLIVAILITGYFYLQKVKSGR